MFQKKIIFLFLLLLSSCGYEAIYSKKNAINYDFSISEIIFVGERYINVKIKEKLNIYTLTKKNKNFKLKISSDLKKLTVGKDTSGDPTNFRSIVTVNVEVFAESSFKDNIQLVEIFNYDNDNDKFELKNYENEIINNLTSIATDRLIFKLSNTQ